MRMRWLVVALLLVFAGSPASGEGADTMPLTLTLEDYNATEKIGHPPRKLSTAGAPAGVDPAVGDIAYYAPWGNLALYYKDFGYSKGLIRIGRITSGLEALRVPGSPKVTIERVAE